MNLHRQILKFTKSLMTPHAASDRDHNVIFLIFRFFIDLDRNLVFKTEQRDYAQSTALGEYLLKMLKFFTNGEVVAEISCLKVEEICKISEKSKMF